MLFWKRGVRLAEPAHQLQMPELVRRALAQEAAFLQLEQSLVRGAFAVQFNLSMRVSE
jgi:hypothetical protein